MTTATDHAGVGPRAAPRSPWWRLGLLAFSLLASLALAWLARATLSPEALVLVRASAERAGPAGAALFLAASVVGVALGIPRAVLATLGGALYGTWVGALLAAAGAWAGCAVVFVYARHLGRAVVRERLSDRARELDRVLGRHGGWLTFLIRIFPVGHGHLSSLLLALTSIRLGPYLLGTAAGLAPQTAIYAALGAGLAAHSARDLHLAAALAGGLAAVVGACCLLRRAFLVRVARAVLGGPSTVDVSRT